MSKSEVKKTIGYFKELLKKRGIKVDKLILFGSFAKGDYRKDSDIDVLVLSQDFAGKDIFERTKMIGDVEWELMEKYMIPIDIITMSPEKFKKSHSPVCQYASEGIVI